MDTHNPMMDASVEEFEKLANINMKGTMLCVRAVSKAMSQQEAREAKGRYGPRNIGRGSIVNLGSGNSYVAVPGQTPYTSSKHAVIGITKSAGRLLPILLDDSHTYVPLLPRSIGQRTARYSCQRSLSFLGRRSDDGPRVREDAADAGHDQSCGAPGKDGTARGGRRCYQVLVQPRG